jgi:hypothetical protein
MIEFTEDEIERIQELSVKDGWDNPLASDIKVKITRYLRDQEIAFCCYCRVSMHGWHNWTIDPEHVLPKSHYPLYTFEILNLNIACKRCNMGIKRADDSFFTGGRGCLEPFKTELYTFVHPNLDTVNDHLHVKIEQSNDSYIRKYWVVNDSAKGAATYAYFRLKELEVESVSDAQGLTTIALQIPPVLAERVVTELNHQ